MRTRVADREMKGEADLLGALLFTLGKAAVERWIAQAQPDVLHAHWVLPNGYLAAGAAARRGIPMVVSIPGSDALVAGQNPLFKRMARQAFATAGLITANSADLREVAVRDLGADPAKFELIIYGVDPQALRPDPEAGAALRQRLGLAADSFVLLGVGRMVPKKGFDSIIQAMPLFWPLPPKLKPCTPNTALTVPARPCIRFGNSLAWLVKAACSRLNAPNRPGIFGVRGLRGRSAAQIGGVSLA